MLKVTSRVEITASQSYLGGYSVTGFDITDENGNSVHVTMTPEQCKSFGETLTERYNRWLKTQAEKAAELKAE